MIPKKIHYCWFGGNKLPEDAKKCIASWKKYCPDYEIIEWNENNYDLNKNDYVKYAYNNKKYAFLTDYVRLDVIYNEGGIYLDTDVELIKPLDDLLNCEAYFGMEQIGTIATGLGFGAEKGNSIVLENKKIYEENSFIDANNKFKPIVCVKLTTELLVKKGLKKVNEIQNIDNIIIYPPEFFCPIKLGTRKINITNNTYSIHHYSASWKSKFKFIRKIQYHLIPLKQFIKKMVHKNE